MTTTIHRYLGALIPAEEGGYTAVVPGPNANAEGATIEEARTVAFDMVQEVLFECMNEGDPLPKPYTAEEILRDYGDLGHLHFFEVAVELSMKSERVNMTMPVYVLAALDRAGVSNRSAFFAQAAMRQLAKQTN